MSDGDGSETFGQYLIRKFHEWQGKDLKGGIKSQNEWAKWLGVSPTSLSVWMNDVRKPVGDNIDRLATKLGEDVYTLLGVPPRMPTDKRAQVLLKIYRNLPAQLQNRLYEVALNLQDESDPEGVSKKAS